MRQSEFQRIHFTGEGFRTLAVYRLFLKAAFAEQRARQAEYDAEVRDWYENGDGRPTERHVDAEGFIVNHGGQGLAFPVCIHGSSRWTDYDSICGGCEDDSTPIELAIGYARERFLRFLDRWEWANRAPGDLNYDTRNELLEWAVSLFPRAAS